MTAKFDRIDRSISRRDGDLSLHARLLAHAAVGFVGPIDQLKTLLKEDEADAETIPQSPTTRRTK